MIEKKRKLYEERITVFLKRLKDLFYEEPAPLQIEYAPFSESISPYEKRLDLKFNNIKKGETWGSNWQRAWFHLTGSVPGTWKNKHVIAKVDIGAEGLIFDQKGDPIASISVWTLWENYDFRRDRFEISQNAKGGEKVDIWLEATAAQLFGVKLDEDRGNDIPQKYGNYEAKIGDVELCVFRKDIWDLYQDCFVLNDLMLKLPENSVRRSRILMAFMEAIDSFDESAKSVKKSRKLLKPELSKKAGESELTAHAVGHAHIDTAWLWPLDETIRKCARTFIAQINNLEKFPEFIFGASQPQHFAFVKQYYPGLYRRIKQKVTEGRFELQGGMWVEADCNLISGESIVRQILHGKNFFKEEFDIEVDNLWLPDVFGYSAALPQILKKSGIDYFLTQKISWSQFNKFPNHTFLWQGIDGTEVITHFPPEDNYNSDLKPSQMIYAQENFKEKAFLDEFAVLFGIGDGGGGPTEEIIETGLRQANLENTPKVKFGTAKTFFDSLSEKEDKLPRWVGELYLELHRGTLTTHAFNKKMNRFMEGRMRELELLYSQVPTTDYPEKEFDGMWKTILINQFHDIIPGSSITTVYERSYSEYRNLHKQSEKLLKNGAEKLFKKSDNAIVFINTQSHNFSGLIDLPESWKDHKVVNDDGNEIQTQTFANYVKAYIEISALSTKTVYKKELLSVSGNQIDLAKRILENDYIKYEFGKDGILISAYDKEEQLEIIKPGEAGNLLSLYEDRPVNWDAWDIDIYYENELKETATVDSINCIANDGLVNAISIKAKIGNSLISQSAILSAHSKRLDFVTEIDWREDHKMLRVSFPININSDLASYDIQYGYVKRATHRNTSWDMAKFEVCGHKYADLSDYDYGAALLNDCKYGYKVHKNILDLNLLRSPSLPDPKADRGKHELTYSFYPHNGS